MYKERMKEHRRESKLKARTTIIRTRLHRMVLIVTPDAELICALPKTKMNTNLSATAVKKLFPYECTNLPTYQIARFLATNYRRYTCVNCTVIPGYVADVIKNKASSPVSTTMANGDIGDVADNLMSSLKSFLTEKVTQIENNVKNTIVSELGKNMKQITELNAGVPSPVNQDSPDGQTNTWSSVVSQPRNLKSVMRPK